ncbi:MAG: hypothetical protein WBK28_03535 [Minisyncoccia bacterium]
MQDPTIPNQPSAPSARDEQHIEQSRALLTKANEAIQRGETSDIAETIEQATSAFAAAYEYRPPQTDMARFESATTEVINRLKEPARASVLVAFTNEKKTIPARRDLFEAVRLMGNGAAPLEEKRRKVSAGIGQAWNGIAAAQPNYEVSPKTAGFFDYLTTVNSAYPELAKLQPLIHEIKDLYLTITISGEQSATHQRQEASAMVGGLLRRVYFAAYRAPRQLNPDGAIPQAMAMNVGQASVQWEAQFLRYQNPEWKARFEVLKKNADA